MTRRSMAGRGALVSVCLLLVAAAAHASARSQAVQPGAMREGAWDGDEARVQARLLVHPDDPAAGPVWRVGVLFETDPGWHLYWRNPGESGLPTQLRWEVDGAQVGPIAWPAPTVFAESDGYITYGYTGQVLLASEARSVSDVNGARTARVEVSALLCRHECIPADFTLSRSLGAAHGGPEPEAQQVRALFEEAAARVPAAPTDLGVELEALYSQSAIRPGDRFHAAIAVHSCRRAGDTGSACVEYAPVDGNAFIPDALPVLDLRTIAVEPHPSQPRTALLILEVDAGERDPETDQRLRGVLALRGSGSAPRHVAVDLALPRARAGAEVARLDAVWLTGAASATRPGEALGLGHALLLALLGGLILNLMPCVLPVLAIKVFSIADLAHRSRRVVLSHGAAYGLGILVTMGVLASAVVLLRAAGASVGWGFQLQEPLFVAGMSTLLVVFALNLFGVFEIEFYATRLAAIDQAATGARRSFFEGLLAVVLATPCTAPFLGTAVGFAFASESPVIFAIFGAIGVGLAAPFALITLVPAWSKWVPRSGPWMLKLRAGLGFALLGSAVWLVWIVGRSIGIDGMVTLVGFLVAVSFVTWLYGSVQAVRRRLLTRGIGLALVVLVVAGLNTIRLEADEPASPSVPRVEQVWQSFDARAIADQLAAGRPVFVSFTADWCITCKVNERFVIADDRVRDEFAQLDVALFRGDWTRRDERIRSELARFGKAGVPMYLIYGPEDPERPVLLPELLSVERVVGALREAAHASPARS